MNDKNEKCCEICGRSTPRDWNGVRVNRCRSHRLSPGTGSLTRSHDTHFKSKSVLGVAFSTMFSALAGVIELLAELLPDENNMMKDCSLVPRSMLHQLEDPDDEGPPHGVVKDPDKYMNPYD